MALGNKDIASALQQIAAYLAMDEVAFKPRAYEKAAATIEGLAEEVRDIYAKGGRRAIEEIPGVGISIAEKIEEFIKTGRIKYYDELRRKTPVDLESFKAVEGLGPKSILRLYKELKIRNLAELEKAAKAGKIRKLEGFGDKSEEKILAGIEFVKKNQGRFVLGFTMPLIREIEGRLKRLRETEKVIVAGSVRRRKETIGDADILIVAKHSKPIMDYFTAMPEVFQIVAKGDTKSAVRLKSGLNVDLRVVAAESYGAALNYFTGSKSHNIALREIAIKKGYKLNEYGLFKGKHRIAGKTEEEIYKALGLDYIPPEMREDLGEITLAKKNLLPDLVNYGDLKGDLQIQTNWTDGNNSIEEMARAAIVAGLEYILITDHTKRLAMTHGLDDRRIQKQWQEIDKINAKFKNKNFKILKGTECDILKDGSLDLKNETLAQLDIVGVSVHSYFNLSRKEQTERIKRAIQNRNVDILFHPTGRILNRREAYEVDMDEIINTAKQTGTILEIDAFPDRLDLKDEYIRKCVKAGVKMSIDSDAHAVSHITYLEYGLAQARRGWASKKDIINAWPLEKMKKLLKS